MSDVLLKNVDRRLYSRLKAEAAAMGKTVGEVFNEVLRFWLSSRPRTDPERERNLEVYAKIKDQLLRHQREYFVIANGAFLGHFSTLAEAFRVMKDNKAAKGLVIRSQAAGEWLGGSLEG